jgi:hypothetical protein
MHWIDARVRREHTGILVVATEPGSPKPSLHDLIRPQGYRARFRQQNRASGSGSEEEIETHFVAS